MPINLPASDSHGNGAVKVCSYSRPGAEFITVDGRENKEFVDHRQHSASVIYKN